MDYKTEVLDDIPLIIGYCQKFNLSDLIDKHLSTHGNQKGLSNGELALVWLAHILTKSNHCKAPVAEWSAKHRLALEALIGKQISDNDLEDCRLSRLLQRFAIDEKWNEFEQAFYKGTFSILQLDTSPPRDFQQNSSDKKKINSTIKIDSTTAYGHHEVSEGGIMKHGKSKDCRPDLPQLKMMVAVEGKTGFQIASDVVPGNKNDDILYLPIIERTRTIVETKNCLFCGDSKMSSLSIKSNIEKNKEFYLTPVQLNEKEKKLFNELVEDIVNGTQEAYLIYERSFDGEKNNIIGAGYEINRTLVNQDEDGLKWTERVLFIKSFDHTEMEFKKCEKSLKKIETDLSTMSSNLCVNEEEARNELNRKLNEYFENNKIKKDFVDFDIKIDFEVKNIKRSEKRNNKVRNGFYNLKKYRCRLENIKINEKYIEEIKRKMGWRIYVTNAPKPLLDFSSAYRFYRKTMYVIEIGFHVLKDYLNISPLYVRNEDQILGMTRMLTLALKILTLMTAELRENLKKDDKVLVGLYAGQPKRKHPSPTVQSILEYFTRQEITLVGMKEGDRRHWGITGFTDKCREILRYLHIPEEKYFSIPEKLESLGFIC